MVYIIFKYVYIYMFFSFETVWKCLLAWNEMQLLVLFLHRLDRKMLISIYYESIDIYVYIHNWIYI